MFSVDPTKWWNRYNWKTTTVGIAQSTNSVITAIQIILAGPVPLDPQIIVRYLLVRAALSGVGGLVSKDSTQGSSLPDVIVDEKIDPLLPTTHHVD